MKLLADKEERIRRMAICQACQFALPAERKTKVFCAKCACVLQGKVITRGDSCPAGKW